MSYNTYITYNGDGSTRDFAIPFSYLKKDDVVVTRHNGPVSYVFLNPNMIRVSKAIDAGDSLVIERRTNITSPSVVFQNGSSFTGDNINKSLDQVRFAVQEAVDRVGTIYARTYNISSIDALFNGILKTFRLDSGGENLGTKIYDSGLWFVYMNGISLELNVDFSVAVTNGIAQITFVKAPKKTDNSKITFIRFYDGALAGGSGVNGAQVLDDLSDVVINTPLNGQVLVYNGVNWINSTSSGSGNVSGGGGSGIDIVSTTPTSCSIDGKTIFNQNNNKLYICKNGSYVDIFAAFTPDVPNGITVVAALPSTGTEGQIVFNKADNKLYRWTSGTWVSVVAAIDVASTVANGSITTAKFASGIRPIEIVSVLPTSGNFEGRIVFLTTDDKLYRYNGMEFTAGTAVGDLVGQIGADKIAANAITAGKIAAGAISATEIAAGAINTANLAAGSITSEKIAALAVTANAIATNAITTDKIAANAITAGKIQAAAIGTDQLAANAVTADKLAANQVLIGTAQIADASISRLKVQGNAITAAASTIVLPQQEVPSVTWKTIASLTMTTTGTQPIMVWADCGIPSARLGTSTSYSLFYDGQYWLLNTGKTEVEVQFLISTTSYAAASGVVGSYTTALQATNCISFSTIFSNVPAGTYTISAQARKSILYPNLENFSVRSVSLNVLETRR